MTSPNKGHKNKLPHNWLAYKISDRFILQHSNLYSGLLVDLGCGDAHYKPFFLTKADSYIGVDWSDSLHHTHADVISDLNQSIDLASDMADTVVTFSVLEHLSEPQNFINEIHRILKDSGHLILQVPWQWHLHEAPYDYFRYSPYGLKHLLRKAGFTEIHVEAQSGVFTTLSLKLNYFLVRKIYDKHWAIKYPMALLFAPIWTLSQMLAPLLDKLDKDWEKEATGFMVTAQKKANRE